MSKILARMCSALAIILASLFPTAHSQKYNISYISVNDDCEECLFEEFIRTHLAESDQVRNCTVSINEDYPILPPGLDMLPFNIDSPVIITYRTLMYTLHNQTGIVHPFVPQMSGQCMLHVFHAAPEAVDEFYDLIITSFRVISHMNRDFHLYRIKWDDPDASILHKFYDHTKFRTNVGKLRQENSRVTADLYSVCNFCDDGRMIIVVQENVSQFTWSETPKDCRGLDIIVDDISHPLNLFLRDYLHYADGENSHIDFVQNCMWLTLNNILDPLYFTHDALFGTSQPYLFENVVFFTKRVQPRFTWDLLLTPLTWSIWVCMSLSLLVYCVVVLVVVRLHGLQLSSMEVGFMLLSPLLNQGMKVPREAPLKLVAGVWLFFCLVMSTLYASKLVGFVLDPPVKNVESLQDLIIEGYTWGSADSGFYSRFAKYNSKDDVHGRIILEMTQMDELKECFTNIHRWKFACFTQSFAFSTLLSTDLYNAEEIYLVVTDLPTLMAGIVLHKGALFYEAVNRGVLLFQSSGMHDYYFRVMFEANEERKLRRKYRYILADGAMPKALTVVELRAAFFCLIAGSIVSVTLLHLEMKAKKVTTKTALQTYEGRPIYP